MTKRKPLYWINPNFRLNFPSFSVEWHLCDASDLKLEMMYGKHKRLMYGIGKDAKQQNTIQDMAVSKYWDFYLFLMKQ